MGNKSYYALISTLLISTVSMFYLYYSSGEEKPQVLTEKVAIEESVEIDEEGGVITPAAKKFEIKRQRRARKVHQTATMKLYEKVDSDAFIARIENQIQESDYKSENSYDPSYDLEVTMQERMEAFKEKEEEVLASHQEMMLAFNTPQDNNLDDSYEMDNDAIDNYEDDIASYDANYDYQ